MLGFKSDIDYYDVTESETIMDFTSVSQVALWISSGTRSYNSHDGASHGTNSCLSVVHVNADYGSMVNYYNHVDDSVTMYDFPSGYLGITLTDQDGKYLDITKPWTCVLKITDYYPVYNYYHHSVNNSNQ